MDKEGGQLLVAMDREWLGVEVGKQLGGWAVGHVKLVVTCPVCEPCEAHVHRLGPFGFDSAVGQADGTFVITKNGGRGLGIANIASSRAVEAGRTCVAVSGTEFRVSSGGNSDGNTGGIDVDGGVDGVRVVVSKRVMASRFRAGTGKGKVGGVGLCLQEHVGRADVEFVVRVGKAVAE